VNKKVLRSDLKTKSRQQLNAVESLIEFILVFFPGFLETVTGPT